MVDWYWLVVAFFFGMGAGVVCLALMGKAEQDPD